MNVLTISELMWTGHKKRWKSSDVAIWNYSINQVEFYSLTKNVAQFKYIFKGNVTAATEGTVQDFCLGNGCWQQENKIFSKELPTATRWPGQLCQIKHGTGLKITFQGFIKYWMYLSTLIRRPNTLWWSTFSSQQILACTQCKAQHQWIFNSQRRFPLNRNRNLDSRCSFVHKHCISSGQPSASWFIYTTHLLPHLSKQGLFCIVN